MRSSVPLVKKYHAIYVDDEDKPFKITSQCCNVYVIRDGKSIEILYINFINVGMATIWLYPEDIVP